MHSNHCKNCEHLLSETHQFCPNCGQTAHIHKFSFGHLLHEFFHAFTHADKGIIHLVKGLATKPGKVVAEYLDGKRKSYFNPFTFFLLCAGFFVFMNALVKPNGEWPKADPAVLARIPSAKGKEMYMKAMERSTTVYTITQKNSNMLALAALPINALIFWIFFRRRGRNYAEFVVAMLFLGSFATFLFSIVISPLMSITRLTHPTIYLTLLIVGLLFLAVYVSAGVKGMLDTRRRTSYWAVLPVGILNNVLWGVGTTVFFLWYVARERTWAILAQMWHQWFG
jgi:hypothetical protein